MRHNGTLATAPGDLAIVETFGAQQPTIPRGLLPQGTACAELHSVRGDLSQLSLIHI